MLKLDLNKCYGRPDSMLLYCTIMYVHITKNGRLSMYSELLNDSMALHSWSFFFLFFEFRSFRSIETIAEPGGGNWTLPNAKSKVGESPKKAAKRPRV